MNGKTILADFSSSIVVLLVALPLCLGIAIASGLPPAAGLISGIVGGIVVGWLAGCPLQVSGPASGLIAVVWEVVQHYGVEHLGIVVLFAGLIQSTIGFLGLAQWFQAVSPAVIHGMLGGIAVLIFASQFHLMVDHVPAGTGIQNLMTIPDSLYKGIMPSESTSHHIAALVGLLTIGTILVWNSLPAKFKIIPPSLVGVAVAVIFSQTYQLPINYIEFPENLSQALIFPNWNSFLILEEWETWVTIFTVAFVASSESLLTATAVDQMHIGPKTNYNKEIIAQGAGNVIAGLLGAIPITGVIVRSGTNVQSGAKTRASTVMHGIWILLTAVFLSQYLEMIPASSLAAILVYVSIKLVDQKALKEIAAVGRSELAIYLATVIVIVIDNLLMGVIVGVALSLLKLLREHSHFEYEIHEEDSRIVIDFIGCGSFTNIPKLANLLDSISSNKEVHLNFNQLRYIDHGYFDFLNNWEKQYVKKGGDIILEWSELEAKLMLPKQRRSKKS